MVKVHVTAEDLSTHPPPPSKHDREPVVAFSRHKNSKGDRLSSLGYCKQHGVLRREDPDVNMNYLNIKGSFHGKENINSYNLDKTH